MKKNIMILCGGQSGEHEVSLLSAKSIFAHIPKDRYQPFLVGISKKGDWLMGDPFLIDEEDPEKIALNPELKQVDFNRGQIGGIKIDAVFPIIHGTFGEDGCLQGLLRMQDLPFVGSDVLGSAVGMDKDIMKKLFAFEKIPTPRHKAFYAGREPEPNYTELTKELGEVLFVKPCNLGSSVGISKVVNREEFDEAINKAFCYDPKILVEEFIEGRELEVAVLGHDELVSSPPGEILPEEEFYSYEAKYIKDNTRLDIPANLDVKTADALRKMAEKAFRTLELSGLSRVDFFLKDNGEIYLNEVNTLPGFTKISMYPKLMELKGISYSDLIHRLIELASQRHTKEKELNRSRA